MSRVLRGMARDFPRTAPSGSLGARVMFFGHVEPDKWPLEELARLAYGSVEGRRPLSGCGGGGYLLMGLGKWQKNHGIK